MLVRAESRFLDLLQVGEERFLRGRIAADRQRIDKHSDQRLHITVVPARNRCADNKVFLSGIFMQHYRIGRKQNHVERGSGFRRKLLQSIAFLGIQEIFERPPFIALDGGTGIICRQFQHRQFSPENVKPVSFLAF